MIEPMFKKFKDSLIEGLEEYLETQKDKKQIDTWLMELIEGNDKIPLDKRQDFLKANRLMFAKNKKGQSADFLDKINIYDFTVLLESSSHYEEILTGWSKKIQEFDEAAQIKYLKFLYDCCDSLTDNDNYVSIIEKEMIEIYSKVGVDIIQGMVNCKSCIVLNFKHDHEYRDRTTSLSFIKNIFPRVDFSNCPEFLIYNTFLSACSWREFKELVEKKIPIEIKDEYFKDPKNIKKMLLVAPGDAGSRLSKFNTEASLFGLALIAGFQVEEKDEIKFLANFDFRKMVYNAKFSSNSLIEYLNHNVHKINKEQTLKVINNMKNHSELDVDDKNTEVYLKIMNIFENNIITQDMKNKTYAKKTKSNHL